MSNTQKTQNMRDVFLQQPKGAKTPKTHGDVRQDKRGTRSDRTAFNQPASVRADARSAFSPGTPHRSGSVRKSAPAAVPLQLWVKSAVKAEVQRLAGQEGVSASALGASLLEEILCQKLHVQQAATIETVIEQCIARSHRALATRLAWLLVRIAFDTGQTRVLTTNILGHLDGVSEDSLKEILATADRRTKTNLTRRSPQLTELMAAVEAWLLAEDEEDEGRAK
jgi:hypothetical protein